MREIRNQFRDDERAYYSMNDTVFADIHIEGPKDGESAFKECYNISVYDSSFSLRYPFWHNDRLYVKNINMKNTARAPFWYCYDLTIENLISESDKAIRESENVKILSSTFVSNEFCWKSTHIDIKNTKIIGFYALFYSNMLTINQVEINGQYSLQYIRDFELNQSYFITKDALWHASNGIIRETTFVGEYIGWYSKDLTFIRCLFKGKQPFCYARNLKLIDCSFEEAELAFENSEVNGTINGSLISIKNPLKGELNLTGDAEYIKNDFDRSNGGFKLNTNIEKKEEENNK